MITKFTNTMTYLIKVSVNPDVLLQTYADGQGILIKNVIESLVVRIVA